MCIYNEISNINQYSVNLDLAVIYRFHTNISLILEVYNGGVGIGNTNGLLIVE